MSTYDGMMQGLQQNPLHDFFFLLSYYVVVYLIQGGGKVAW